MSATEVTFIESEPMFLRVLAAALIILAIAIFVPALFIEHEPPRNLPWQIDRVDDTIRVFGVTLGHTTLAQAERAFGGPAEVSLFRMPSGKLAVEGYFNEVDLSGLGARVVATVDLDQQTLQKMFERGLRVSTLGRGTRKVTLSPADLQQVMNTPVLSLTYLPKVNLTDAQVLKRFGKPARKVPDPESRAVHWLYPQLGLDVALSPKEKEVLQYVPPARFGSLERPLLPPPSQH